MINDKSLLKGNIERLNFLRWVLLLIAAAEAAGISSLTRSRLHSFLFLSFASAPFYGLKPLRQRAQRTPQGPYYRAAHLALGYLTLGNLIAVDNFTPYNSKKNIQFEGDFKITIDGLKLSRELRKANSGKKIYNFLLDLCLASVRAIEARSVEDGTLQQIDSSIDKILTNDLSYQKALQYEGQYLDPSDTNADSTPTVIGLRSISSFLEVHVPLNRKDILSAYQSILLDRAG